MANKFVKRYITWVVGPDHAHHAYLDSIMADSEKDAPKRFNYPAYNHHWCRFKFIHVPIKIRVPKELEGKVKEENII